MSIPKIRVIQKQNIKKTLGEQNSDSGLVENKSNIIKNVWQEVFFNSRRRNINETNNNLVFTTKANCRTKNMTLTKLHRVKFQKKLDYIQNAIYKCWCEKLAVHLQWQRIEELGQVPQKYTFWRVCHVLKWIGAILPEDVQIVQDTFRST